MKEWIILSPSKEMDKSPGILEPALDSTSQSIYQAIGSLSEADLGQWLKLSDSVAHEVYQDYLRLTQARAKPAIATYQGLAFRQIDPQLGQSEFAQDHLVILSALYGPLHPLTPINPYRLDFSKALTVEGQSLSSLQKANYTHFFKGSRVYNLASKEFSDRVDQNQVADWVAIDFYSDWKSGKKAASPTAKKLRDQLVNHLLGEASLSKDTFASFQYQGYRLHPESTANHYIYANYEGGIL
ncbi:peroxide stress protein YaaA [Hutsoniella sourekii]|uniref:peroxide stress protein YaaA n=1 Tax=Hutsoniella sourekii TaxID=87650 RepID=UPI0004833753|nr:peroxide stress protein YaaA [Hutsoniella sourekii]